MADGVEKTAEEPLKPVQRLCNEIQLFDLCELESCRHKQGLFCTHEELLGRFEAIADVEERPAAGRISGGIDEEDDLDGDGYDDGYQDEEYPDDGYEEDE